MAEIRQPRSHRVWSEHQDENEGLPVMAHTPRGAVLMAIAELDDDGALVPDDASEGEESVEDWIVRDPDGVAHRFRCMLVGREHVGVTTLRTCRVCACTDDRACDPPCAWSGANLCDACAAVDQPKELLDA